MESPELELGSREAQRTKVDGLRIKKRYGGDEDGKDIFVILSIQLIADLL